MIACVSSLNPQELSIDHPPLLEIMGISVSDEQFGEMYIVAVY